MVASDIHDVASLSLSPSLVGEKNTHKRQLSYSGQQTTKVHESKTTPRSASRARVAVNPAAMDISYLSLQLKPVFVTICAELVPKRYVQVLSTRTHTQQKPRQQNQGGPVYRLHVHIGPRDHDQVGMKSKQVRIELCARPFPLVSLRLSICF